MPLSIRQSVRRVRRSLKIARQEVATRLVRQRECRHERRLLHDGTPHILVLREREARLNDAFFRWLDRTDPQAAARFRHVPVWSDSAITLPGTALLVSWINDPVQERDPRLFRTVREIESLCESWTVPIINRAQSLSNGIKSRALPLLRAAGLRTARVTAVTQQTSFDDLAESLGLPFIVRNDQQHCTPAYLIRTRTDFAQLDWTRLCTPIALEFIDTRSPDGLYRKFRYLMAGNSGITRHLVITSRWCAHAEDRIRGPQYLQEERDALHGPNPFHDDLNRGRIALDLDYVAFDYSIDRSGELIVWEPNPFPCLWTGFNESDSYFRYQRTVMDRVFSLMLRYYFARAGFEVRTPTSIESS